MNQNQEPKCALPPSPEKGLRAKIGDLANSHALLFSSLPGARLSSTLTANVVTLAIMTHVAEEGNRRKGGMTGAEITQSVIGKINQDHHA